MRWWGWIVVGALLLSSELFVPTDFFLVFLGVAALDRSEGSGSPVSRFRSGASGCSSARSRWCCWWRCGGASKRRLPAGDPRVDDTLVGEIALIHERLDAGATGRAELRGSQWTARNADATPLEPGARARVERVEGLVLHVRRAS